MAKLPTNLNTYKATYTYWTPSKKIKKITEMTIIHTKKSFRCAGPLETRPLAITWVFLIFIGLRVGSLFS